LSPPSSKGNENRADITTDSQELRIIIDLGDFHGEANIYGKVTEENMQLLFTAIELKAGLKANHE